MQDNLTIKYDNVELYDTEHIEEDRHYIVYGMYLNEKFIKAEVLDKKNGKTYPAVFEHGYKNGNANTPYATEYMQYKFKTRKKTLILYMYQTINCGSDWEYGAILKEIKNSCEKTIMSQIITT